MPVPFDDISAPQRTNLKDMCISFARAIVSAISDEEYRLHREDVLRANAARCAPVTPIKDQAR